ncbi:ABC-type branched-chain amino acid transport system, substrate-binding protein [Modicisalibacter muralis]|uniref:ABC-type branched-chain amino acid transport system, substrate-binding protein n=1 Tax=Modicisalibacter muralis TaxID=119000 RepID=A0A1G9QCB9_9GAMM|nr:ABC transporter substrate-binding protein [Halomonas muralis]SDM08712.1 ABC-type branched-chain amino acid transport system, substrate-binding protein [Halomonas muralis]
MVSFHRSICSPRRGVPRIAALAGSIAIAGSAMSSALAQEAPPTITLGQIAPFTGSAAEFGRFYEDAVALAVEQLNTAAEEVFGGPIIARHITEDTNTLPAPGIEAARKLVEVDGVAAIVGGWSSGVTTAIAESVSIPSGVLQVANGATSPLISVLPSDEQADLIFRTTSPDTLQGIVAAQLANGEIIDDYKFKTAATIYINNPYGQGLSNSFTESFESRGGKVVAQVPHPEEVQPTYRSQLSTALEQDPDLLMVVSYPGHTAVILQETRDFFDMDEWQFVDGNKSTAVLEAVGAETLAGKYGTSPGQNPASPGYENFSKAYDHQRIPPFTASAYDAAIAIGLATAAAIASGEEQLTGEVLRDHLRPVSNPPGKEITGGSQEAITQAMKMIKEGQDINYAGASGAVDFDEQGDVVTPIEVWKFTADGGVETVEYQSAEEIPEK